MPTEALFAFGMLKLTSLMFAFEVETAAMRGESDVCLIAATNAQHNNPAQ